MLTSPARRRSALAAILSVLVTATFLLGVVPRASANLVGTGTHPWVVVLCKSNNEPTDPGGAGSLAFYRQMYTDAGANSGQYNFVDWWRDVSFGQLSVSGTIVASGPHADANGWYTMPETRDSWGYTKGRYDKVVDCANAAVQDVNFSNYYGVIAVFPEAGGAHTTAALSTSATTMTLDQSTTTPTPGITTTNYYPNVPFMMNVANCDGTNAETVNVTAMSGTQFTVTRGVNGTTAAAHDAASCADVPGDFGEVGGTPVGLNPDGTPTGQSVVSLADGTHNLSLVVLPNETNISGVQHETGHGLGYNHSRKLSYSTTDYKDATDIMSVYDSTFEYTTLGTTFGGAVLGSQPNDKGPGLTAINLDAQGWIPSARRDVFNNAVPNQSTITLHALGDPNALSGSGFLEARVPAVFPIENASPGTPTGPTVPTIPATCTGTGYACTNSQYYTVEYRQKAGWDSGFTSSSVVLHAFGADGRAYWIDQTPLGHSGLLTAGDEFADATHNTFIAVNAINGTTAQVTLGSTKIAPSLVYSGPTSANYGFPVTLAGDLTVGGAPVPSQLVTLSIGSQSCVATTNAVGHAACAVTLTQTPGSYTATASFVGDTVYTGASGTKAFTILKAPTTTTVTANPSGSVGFGHPVTFTAAVAPAAPGIGTPTGSVAFKVDGLPVGTVPVTSASITTSALTPGNHVVAATYSGDGNFLGSTGTISYAVTCSKTVTGVVNGSVIASGDSTCVVNAQVSGAIIVPRGTSLAVVNSTIGGSITAPTSPGAVEVCGSTVGGSVTVTGAVGLVVIGDPVDLACAPNTITGSLLVRDNTHGVEVIGNTIHGALVASNNSGPGPFPGDATTISGNMIG